MLFYFFRHLLRHPAVTSFLWLKWQRVRRFVCQDFSTKFKYISQNKVFRFFSRNIRMYLMFVTCLTWYIFTRFGGIKLNSSEPGIDPGGLGSPGEPISNSTQFCKQPRYAHTEIQIKIKIEIKVES